MLTRSGRSSWTVRISFPRFFNSSDGMGGIELTLGSLRCVGIESAAFPGQTQEEIDRLMHMVVVGGGPTGVEYAGELHDFLIEDLKKWYPGSFLDSFSVGA
jgi:hypothetical protein